MERVIEDLIVQATNNKSRTSGAVMDGLMRQLQISGRHHAPSEMAVTQAIELDNPAIIRVLMNAERLDEESRTKVAGAGAKALMRDPLARRQSAGMLKALVQAGGIPSADQCEALGETLGRIEAGEAKVRQGRGHDRTGAGEALRGCWQVLEAAGVDLNRARNARRKASGNPPPIGRWQHGRALPGAAHENIAGVGRPKVS